MPLRPDTDDMINFLNSLLVYDRHFVQELVALRVPCNEQIANHPSVQAVGGADTDGFIRKGEYRCGVLGILNGYCGAIDYGEYVGWGPIAAIYDQGLLVKFIRTDSEEYEQIKAEFNLAKTEPLKNKPE
jgi:hypothetical protein